MFSLTTNDVGCFLLTRTELPKWNEKSHPVCIRHVQKAARALIVCLFFPGGVCGVVGVGGWGGEKGEGAGSELDVRGWWWYIYPDHSKAVAFL